MPNLGILSVCPAKVGKKIALSPQSEMRASTKVEVREHLRRKADRVASTAASHQPCAALRLAAMGHNPLGC